MNARSRLLGVLACVVAALLLGLQGLGMGPFAIAQNGRTPAVSDALALIADAESATVAPVLSDEERSTVLRRALRAEPLNASPLFVEAFFVPESDAALEAALRRNRRHVPTRRLLALRMIQNGDPSRGLAEVSRLWAIDPSSRAAYANEIAGLATTPEGRDALMAWVRDAPPDASQKVVSLLNAEFPDLAFLYDLNRALGAVQPTLLERLRREGQLELAYVAWLDVVDPEVLAEGLPYDSHFTRQTRLGPFDWVTSAKAEFAREGGLWVVHQGTEPNRFARQYLALGPGSYSLDVIGEGKLPPGGGGLSVQVRCVEEHKRLAVMPFVEQPTATFDESLDFAVPVQNCGFQYIDIAGAETEFPRLIRFRIDQVEIVPVAGANWTG